MSRAMIIAAFVAWALVEVAPAARAEDDPAAPAPGSGSAAPGSGSSGSGSGSSGAGSGSSGQGSGSGAPGTDRPSADRSADTKATHEFALAVNAFNLGQQFGQDGKPKCSGYGLLTPLFGLSNRGVDRTNPNRRSELRITGPVASGFGGGYYRSVLGDSSCSRDFLLDWEVFGFSEGLDPASTFQIGVGGGLGITAFGKFQFGIALGYDLIRRETISQGGVSRTYSNGLLEWNDVSGCGTTWGGPGATRCMGRNFTWLLTFGVTNATSDTPKPKTADSGAGDKR